MKQNPRMFRFHALKFSFIHSFVMMMMIDDDDEMQLKVEDILCPDAFVVVYAVVDRESYDRACDLLYHLTTTDIASELPVIVVANKTDIVRHRCITEEGPLLLDLKSVVRNRN